MFPFNYGAFSTLPNNRNYEFNLNYILKEIKDFRDILDNRIDDLIFSEIEKVLVTFKLDYNKSTQTVYLTGGAKLG